MDYLNLENGMKINPLLAVLLENVVFSVFFFFLLRYSATFNFRKTQNLLESC